MVKAATFREPMDSTTPVDAMIASLLLLLLLALVLVSWVGIRTKSQS